MKNNQEKSMGLEKRKEGKIKKKAKDEQKHNFDPTMVKKR